MNRIQQISVDIQAHSRRETLGLDPASPHSPKELRDLCHAQHLDTLKRRLRVQFAPDAAKPDPA